MFGLSPLPRTLNAALRDFEDPKLRVRLAALRDLVRHARDGSTEAERALERALADPLADIRAAAAVALADAERAHGVEALTRLATDDPEPQVRQMALLALGELGSKEDPAVLAALKRASRAELPAERFQATLALHQLDAPEAEAAILAGMEDEDPEVRRLAFRVARAHFEDARALPDTVRTRARAALGASEPEVRRAAAFALADFGDTSGKGVLLELLSGRGPRASVEDHQAAIELAAELGLEEARPLLARRAFARFLRDPLAYDARIALARLGDERAKAEILNALSAWTRDGRTLAVAAVGRARLGEARARLVELLDRPERADPTAVREALALLDESEPAA